MQMIITATHIMWNVFYVFRYQDLMLQTNNLKHSNLILPWWAKRSDIMTLNFPAANMETLDWYSSFRSSLIVISLSQPVSQCD